MALRFTFIAGLVFTVLLSISPNLSFAQSALTASGESHPSNVDLDILSKLAVILQGLKSILSSQNTVPVSQQIAAGGFSGYAGSSRIDNLTNTTIQNPTITGGSISGTSISGTISNAINSLVATIANLFVTAITGTTATFVNATTTNATTTSFAAIGQSYFAGSVGIGTTSPWARISVQAADNSLVPLLVVGSSTATSLFVNGAGNVGIGTVTPVFPLDVVRRQSHAAIGVLSQDSTGVNWPQLSITNYQGSNLGSRPQIVFTNRGGTIDAPGGIATGTALSSIVTWGRGSATVAVGNLEIAAEENISVTSAAASMRFFLASFGSPNLTEKMRITGQGYLAIGTTSATAKTHVLNTASIDSLRVDDVLGDATPFVIDQAGNTGVGTSTPWRTLSVAGTVGFDGLTGSIGAGSLCLTANREVVFNSGSDNCLSSLRMTKHEIAPLQVDPLAQIQALQPVSFIYNDDASSTVRYGFIAEDTANVDAHLGTYNQAGEISGVDDRALLSVIVSALQKMIDQVADFADHVTTKELTFTRATGEEINAHKLCLDGLCITKAELQTLLNQAGQQSAPAPTPDDAATTTEPGSGTP